MDYFFDEDDEFGDVKKKSPRPTKVTKVIRAKPRGLTFNERLAKSGIGQSQNIEDRRASNPAYVGNRLVQVYGYLTRNTWFHLASQVKYDILNALQSHNFGVIYVAANGRDVKNSQYNFEIHLRVFKEYTKREVINSLIYTLGQTIALPNSIRIINSYEYKK
jgi:hypothetical protein